MTETSWEKERFEKMTTLSEITVKEKETRENNYQQSCFPRYKLSTK